MKRTAHPRCCECRQLVYPGQPRHTVKGPAGLRAGLIHREVTNTWHEACWADVVRFATESRAEHELQRLADLRSMAEALGLSPAEVSRIAQESGSADPYRAVTQ